MFRSVRSKSAAVSKLYSTVLLQILVCSVGLCCAHKFMCAHVRHPSRLPWFTCFAFRGTSTIEFFEFFFITTVNTAESEMSKIETFDSRNTNTVCTDASGLIHNKQL